MFKDKEHFYLPDFKLCLNSGEVFIVEIKSSYFEKQEVWTEKLKALKIFCFENNFKYDVISEKRLKKWLEQLKE